MIKGMHICGSIHKLLLVRNTLLLGIRYGSVVVHVHVVKGCYKDRLHGLWGD